MTATATEAPALEVEDLEVNFISGEHVTYVLEGVSLEVRKGEALGIVGESGSGKSVLARTILGIRPRGTTIDIRGAVRVSGEDQLDASEAQIRSRAGALASMIYQDPMRSLNPTVRVWKQIVEAITNRRRVPASDARARAVELLRSVGVPDPEARAMAYPGEFSGGMLQRVGIAAAIAAHPDLLLADEPTTALDVTVQRRVLDLLDEVRAASGMGLVLVTHDLGLLADRTDRTVVMYAGRIMETGPTSIVASDPAHPYTKGLLAAIPRLTGPIQRELPAIGGSLPPLSAPRAGCPFAARCPVAQERCATQRPPAVLVADGHTAHCWAVADEQEATR
ncbi:ABC transporter ATP-binding protein [Demequina rhizosphaerae]|uniref:ABC transporter ATP-binding protein n=1 Tax=Demequina rhizosphaerae TaxID=1638985 RepID=UPI00078027CD|nr:ABC transporter ATP-binding protein [Demequina rhizosphaerae]